MQFAGGQQQQVSPRKNIDPAFKGVGNEPGLIIWRVENFGLKKLPSDGYGTFHNGDSYLVLKSEGKAPPFNHDVHFWLGKATSQDEAGTAALKAVELDEVLGGAPTQYREIQQHESRKFCSYFKKGIQYREGGVRSGFQKVEQDTKKRLLHVKGRKRPRVSEVPVHCDSLNHGDVFILDNGSKIWVWCGSESNRAERRKAMEFARDIRDNERAGKSFVNIVEDDPHSRPQKDNKNDPLSQFFNDLGSYGRIKPPCEKAEDEKVERQRMKDTTLHRVSDSSGQMRVTEIAKGNLKYSYLDSSDAFLVDQGGTGLYVWVGKGASKEEKLQGMKVAVNFLRSKKYPDYTEVKMVKQGMETALFKQCFVDWPRNTMNFQNKTYTAGRGIANVQQTHFDAKRLHEQRTREDSKMFDDGNGKIDIWRVENFKLVPQNRDLVGTFFGGDCYVILYTYQKNGKENYIIYYWLGRESTADEQGTAAAMTIKMDDSLGGAPLQIRVVQGKEPPHFLRIFKGKMIIYKGGKASGFRGHQQEVQDHGRPRLFQVRGNAPERKKALEVEAVAASLNSNDVFVLVGPSGGYLWYGKGCSGDERELGKELAGRIAPRYAGDFGIVQEGKESQEFWHQLGGKGEYASGAYYEQEIPEYPPRLFLCSNATGRFEVEEIFNFTQEDMDDDDVMLLDTYDSIFLWIGQKSNSKEKQEAMKTAVEYLKTDPSGRDPERVQIMVVNQGFEPPQMTGCFLGWDDEVFAHGKSYEEIKKEFQDANAGITLVQEELTKYSFDTKHPYEVLKQAEVPEGVDPTRKEYYLEPEEFKQVFSMSLNNYEELPQWKKDNFKKKTGLF